ncbi:MAG: hypothetical protein ABIT01_12675 [Thermoanaerobaculia bacterium]
MKTVRRAVALLLVVSGFAALLFRARPDAPLSASISLMRKFWGANERTRRLNSPALREHTAFGLALLDADEAWPLQSDARLCLPSALAPGRVEDLRRRAAFVLSPRFVQMARGDSGPAPFALEPWPAPVSSKASRVVP